MPTVQQRVQHFEQLTRSKSAPPLELRTSPSPSPSLAPLLNAVRQGFNPARRGSAPPGSITQAFQVGDGLDEQPAFGAERTSKSYSYGTQTVHDAARGDPWNVLTAATNKVARDVGEGSPLADHTFEGFAGFPAGTTFHGRKLSGFVVSLCCRHSI